MATLIAPSVMAPSYSGEAPLAVAHGQMVLSAAGIGDRIRLKKVYAGTKVYEAKLVNEALGADSTVSLGFEYADGQGGGSDTAFLPATSTVAAAATRSDAAPIFLERDAYIVAVVGGGVATGQIDSVLTFEFKGV